MPCHCSMFQLQGIRLHQCANYELDSAHQLIDRHHLLIFENFYYRNNLIIKVLLHIMWSRDEYDIVLIQGKSKQTIYVYLHHKEMKIFSIANYDDPNFDFGKIKLMSHYLL